MDRELRLMIFGLVIMAGLSFTHDIWWVASRPPRTEWIPFVLPLVFSGLATAMWKYRSRL